MAQIGRLDPIAVPNNDGSVSLYEVNAFQCYEEGSLKPCVGFRYRPEGATEFASLTYDLAPHVFSSITEETLIDILQEQIRDENGRC